MPAYESSQLYVDFSRLPPPQVIEEIDYEKLLQIYHAEVLSKNPALARALKLEQSGANIVLETEAYAEMITRARVNAAARAVMLPFAVGSDLDNLAAFYGVKRMDIPGDDTVTPKIPASKETDASLRRRAQMAPESMATAGSEGAYIYHTLSAHPGVRDATAVKIDNFGGVKITVMATGANPVPTDAIIDAVYRRLHAKNIKPLTDVISVSPVEVIEVDLLAELTLYPGPNASLVMADVQKGLNKLRSRVNMIGMDLTRSAIHSALYQEGVQNVRIISPETSIQAETDQCVVIKTATVDVVSEREE